MGIVSDIKITSKLCQANSAHLHLLGSMFGEEEVLGINMLKQLQNQ